MQSPPKLLLKEGKSGEAWEPSQNQPYFGNPGGVGKKALLCFSYLRNWDTFQYGLSCSLNTQEYLDRMDLSGWGLWVNQQFTNARTAEPHSWLCPPSIKMQSNASGSDNQNYAQTVTFIVIMTYGVAWLGAVYQGVWRRWTQHGYRGDCKHVTGLKLLI